MNKTSSGDIRHETRHVSLEDPEVIEAVNGFLADLEQGEPADRQELIHRFPEIASELTAGWARGVAYRAAPPKRSVKVGWVTGSMGFSREPPCRS